MFSLDDIMLNRNRGAIVDLVSRQFDLSRDQTIAAIEALMPAFGQGLRHSFATPEGQLAFFRALAESGRTGSFSDLSEAFTSAGIREGNAVLGNIFGSKEVSRAVAEYAAKVTGIDAAKLREMLPPLAVILMDAMSPRAAAGISGTGAGRDAMDANPFTAYFEQSMRMLQPKAASPGEARSGPAENPFADLQREFLKTVLSAGGGEDANRQRERNEPEPPQPESAPEDRLDRLFATSREIQAGYFKGMEALFERYLPNKK